MAKLALSSMLFTGALVYFAEEVASTSDLTTKPAADNAAWKEIGSVENLKHNPDNHEEPYSIPSASRGWMSGKQVFTLADLYDLTTRETSELVHRLAFGVAAPLVAGTAQTPHAEPERMVRGWIKIQHRQVGAPATDRARMDIFCEIRLKDEPAVEKKVQVPVLELFELDSTLNSVVIPA